MKYTLNKYHVHWLSSFKHLNLPISIKMANYLYLHDSYITKFDFMNDAFAKLVLAWLYRLTHEILILVLYEQKPPLTLNVPIATKVVCFSRLLKCLRSLYGKQCGPRTDCSYRSSLLCVHAVCFYA